MNNATTDLSQYRFSIAEASDFLNVSFDTIRRWEKKGLVKAHRNSAGHRLFSLNEITKLKAKLAGGEGVGYRILKADKPSKFQVIELFAGAGGLALGLEHAGLKTKLLVEIDKNAAQTLRHNFKNGSVIQDDIANVHFNGLETDILTGGFPFQAFSYAGKRLGFDDVRGTLFFEYVRAIKATYPKVILAENVRGLEKHDGGRTLKIMLQILSESGYRMAYKVLRTQYLDVPQKRERLVIIGIRKELDLPILFPLEQDYTISLKETLENVPVSQGQSYTKKKFEIMQQVPEGGCWHDLPLELQKQYMGKSFYLSGGKTGMARRLSWDEPSLTLTCNPAQKQTERCHPSETRPLTVREYARIQTFPDTWEFSGSTASQYKQIGNAVPVNLGYHLGRCLIATLNRKPDLTTMLVLNETPS